MKNLNEKIDKFSRQGNSEVTKEVLDALNAKHYKDPIPPELSDVYEEEDYLKSQNYKTIK